MFQRILVPLDGSRRAESAIPVAATIARATGGSLYFLRVVTLPGDTALFVQEPLLFPESSGEDELRHAEEYLKLQAQKIRDLSVQTRIVTGLAAPKILSCLEDVADQLLDGSRLPLLVIHPMLPAQTHHVPFSQEEALYRAASFKESAKKREC